MTGQIRRRRRWQGPRKPGTTSMQLWSSLRPPPILSTWQTPNIRDFENLRSFFCSPPSFFNFAPAQLLPDQANPSSALPHFESLTCQILTRRLELAHDHDEERLLGDRPHLGAHPQSGHQGLVVCKSVLFWKKWKTVKYNLQKAGKWERIRECQANWLGVVDEKTPLFFNHRTKATASKGRVALPNRMNFRKNSSRPSPPPPHFRKFT